jgi:hypothetical protein
LRFEFLIVCSPAAPSEEELRELLFTTLTDNLNDSGYAHLTGVVTVTHLRQCPAAPDATNPAMRQICCFAVELGEETENLTQVIDDFCSALNQTEGLKHVLKFFDSHLLEQNIALMRELFVLEMKLRKVLSVIYLAAYEDGYYNLLRDEIVEIKKKDGNKPSDAEMQKVRENQFFHLLFSDYIKLNKRRPPTKPEDVIALFKNAVSFETFREELNRMPIQHDEDAELVASLQKILDPIEKLRNCVAHNHAPSQAAIDQYNMAKPTLEQKLDDFLSNFEPVEEAVWERAARKAVEQALEGAQWDEESGEVRLTGFNEDIRTATNREELQQELEEIARDAWTAYVPFDGGETVFHCDEYGIVESAIEPYEKKIEEFFGSDDPKTE